MNPNTTTLIQISPEQLQEAIIQGVKSQLDSFLENYKPKKSTDLLTRDEVAELLQVNPSTIWNWCNKGKLKPLGIGARVYFRLSDIEASLIPLNAA